MGYEIDFVGSLKTQKDYDAIAFRYQNECGKWVKCVYDGGTSDAGEDLVKHLKNYYCKEDNHLDYVFCSHADLDHASGLLHVLSEFDVNYLVMNRPWLYAEQIFSAINDDRVTQRGLINDLKDHNPFILKLEEMAMEKGCRILDAVSDANGNSGCVLQILSPSREFYVNQLIKQYGSDHPKISLEDIFNPKQPVTFGESKDFCQSAWGRDAIREDIETSPRNEVSCVLYVSPPSVNPFLLTGDAGRLGLQQALDYASFKRIDLRKCHFLQIPHHGGRHNVTPSILNKLIGPLLPQKESKKIAFVSVSANSDHPRKCVVNSFINRGCDVYVARANSLSHHEGAVPDRGWKSAVPESFSLTVEKWNS